MQIVIDNSVYWRLNNDIQALIDTDNRDELDSVVSQLAEAYEDGKITPEQCGELSYDLVRFRDSLTA